MKLDNYELFNSYDLDEARELVANQFCAHHLEIKLKQELFHVRLCQVRGKQIVINYIKYGASVVIEPGELEDFYLIQIPISGHAEISNGGIDCHSNVWQASVLNPDRYTKMLWHAGCEQLIIYIDIKILHKIAEYFIGRSLRKSIIFENLIDFRRPEMQAWRQNVLALFAATSDGQFLLDDNTKTQNLIEQEILTRFLALQPSNIHQFHQFGADLPTAVYIKRAKDFIIQNANMEINVSDIAKAAGVPIRTLQNGFADSLHKSPMVVLRDERLMQVWHELASGQGVDNVTSTATAWGFYHFGRFSAYYQQKFGQLPSQTMADALKKRHFIV
ncbi:MAG: AraC family transcriptional regulator [Rhizobiales bacterium]|nr:AraC family transcriptional regulator [Hyphomicrobiales bacterium]